MFQVLLGVEGWKLVPVPQLGSDEPVPGLFPDHCRACFRDGTDGSLHRLRMDRVARDRHLSLHDAQQLGITEVSQERRLCHRSIPADQLGVCRGTEVDVGDGESPAFLGLLLARGADQLHGSLTNLALPVGDHGQQELLGMSPEAVALNDWPDDCL